MGQIIAMVLLAALTTLGLWALGMPYFLAFGVFAGVAAIVPFFGVLLSTVVPALFALGAFGLTKALLVAALGVVVHLIEANFVAPVVMERQVNLPPVVTIAGVLLIGKLFGLGGPHHRGADPGAGDDPGPPHPRSARSTATRSTR